MDSSSYLELFHREKYTRVYWRGDEQSYWVVTAIWTRGDTVDFTFTSHIDCVKYIYDMVKDDILELVFIYSQNCSAGHLGRIYKLNQQPKWSRGLLSDYLMLLIVT